MTRIYLLRHGQTQFNQKERIQGSCDSKLTVKGVKQAKDVKTYLDKINFAAVFCSTSERTLDTVTYATGGRYPITPCKAFKEIDFGDLEGDDESKQFAGLETKNFQFLLLNEGWSAVNGETGFSMTKRVFAKLDEIVAKYPNENILIACHGGTIMNIVMNIDHDLIKSSIPGPENCSITIIDYHGKYRLIDYNLNVSN